ncbi:hypothetical protein ACLB2K_032372 [Fragaria x ananassa]
MHSLRLLDLYYPHSNTQGVNKVHLLPGFEFLPESLKYLRWDFYPLPSMPSRFSSENLVELRMRKSRLVQLWNKNVQIDLGNLKHIDLEGSEHLAELPDLSGSPNLERIILEGCSSLVQLPSSFQHHAKLKDLNLIRCSSLKILPQMPSNLVILQLETAIGEYLPSSIWSLEKLESLSITYCEKLIKNLPSNTCRLNSLRFLHIHSCLSLETLSVELPAGLKHLDLSGCKNLGSLPVELPAGLAILRLTGCESLGSLPVELPAGLAILALSRCKNLGYLPVKLPAGLERLHLTGCESLRSLPVELPTGLKYLDFKGCKSLGSLPVMLPAGLRILNLTGCESLGSLPIKLPAELKYLCLNGYKNLRSLLVELPAWLENLDLSGCKNLGSLLVMLPAGNVLTLGQLVRVLG